MPLARPATEEGAATLALSLIKQPGIAAFSENNNRARQAQLHFAAVRDAVLEEHAWQFADVWTIPAASLTAGTGHFAKRFPLPADCIAVREVMDLEPDEWAMEAATGAEVKVLVTDAEEPNVRYTQRATIVALWSPLFLQVFAHRLAAAMAPMLTKNDNDAMRLTGLADELLAPAQQSDRRERARSEVSRSTSWIRARRTR